MKRILTYGTFDLLHFGHIEILRRAKELRWLFNSSSINRWI